MKFWKKNLKLACHSNIEQIYGPNFLFLYFGEFQFQNPMNLLKLSINAKNAQILNFWPLSMYTL